MSQNALLLLDAQNYNYGTVPKQAVAEQNQTFFAYFDGVGGTGPEIIDQTAYFIKYLIDTEGNVVNPEPDAISNRPQAIGLYNLNNNFEPGKRAVVKLIESDPTLPESINGDAFDNALTGIYPITHVGRIATLMSTEYGIANSDHITTMSLQEYGTFIQGEPPNFYFEATKVGNTTHGISNPIQPTDALLAYTQVNSNELGYYDSGTSTYTFGESTSDYGIALQFEASVVNTILGAFEATPKYDYTLSFWIELSTDGGTVWEKLPIQEYPWVVGGSGVSPNNNNPGSVINGDTYIFSSNAGAYGNNIGVSKYHNIRSLQRSFQNGNKVRVKYTITRSNPPAGTPITSNIRIYGTPSTDGADFRIVSNTGYSNQVTSSFFVDISNPSTTYPLQTQFLTASANFSSFLNSDFIQILDSLSIEQGFSQPVLPANIQPGDKIRFEYNPDQVSTVINVLTTDETPSRVCLELWPAIIPNGVNLDHFVIYRILNDGTYIILDVPKPIQGKNFSGIIQPEFVSQELVNNYDKIIVDLTEREIIN